MDGTRHVYVYVYVYVYACENLIVRILSKLGSRYHGT
jgi:hypothetical protein